MGSHSNNRSRRSAPRESFEQVSRSSRMLTRQERQQAARAELYQNPSGNRRGSQQRYDQARRHPQIVNDRGVFDDARSATAARSAAEDNPFKGKAVAHDMRQVGIEALLLALIGGCGVGVLSWVVDRVALKFFVDDYDAAGWQFAAVSGLLCAVVVMVCVGLFVVLDRATSVARGIFVAMVWVGLLACVAGVVLSSFSVYAVVYVVVVVGVAVAVSNVPSLVSDNRIVSTSSMER